MNIFTWLKFKWLIRWIKGGKVMDIGTMSIAMNQSALQSAVSVSVLKMAMNSEAQTSNQMVKIMDNAAIREDMGSGLYACSFACKNRTISHTSVIGDFIPPVIQIVVAPIFDAMDRFSIVSFV
jgi:predicted hotdog family 3-hydroxylacyl-ACP dehydratase